MGNTFQSANGQHRMLTTWVRCAARCYAGVLVLFKQKKRLNSHWETHKNMAGITTGAAGWNERVQTAGLGFAAD
jgi:hypothetical protein